VGDHEVFFEKGQYQNWGPFQKRPSNLMKRKSIGRSLVQKGTILWTQSDVIVGIFGSLNDHAELSRRQA